MSNSVLTQRESVYYSGTITLLLHNLQQVAGDVSCDEIDSKDTSDPTHSIKLFDVSAFYIVELTAPRLAMYICRIQKQIALHIHSV